MIAIGQRAGVFKLQQSRIEMAERESDWDVRDLVRKLMDTAKMTPQEIAEELENRVSSRTIYRWAKGESEPQQRSDVDALMQLVMAKGISL
jgi:DNA-binding transcriptional regulator YiaG